MQYFLQAVPLVVLVPGLPALISGQFTFRSKIKGVYSSIIIQAPTFAGTLLLFRSETGFGGNNSFTGFTTILGFPVTATPTRITLFLAIVMLLVLAIWLGLVLARSKSSHILTTVRGAESRLIFYGYGPKGFKLLAWMLSAVLHGLVEAPYVPQVGIINPSEVSLTNSTEAAIQTVPSGCRTLIGPVFGVVLANGAKNLSTAIIPEHWQLLLGLTFTDATLFLPGGVIGLFRKGDK